MENNQNLGQTTTAVTPQVPGSQWQHIVIPLVVFIVLIGGYGVLAKTYHWWPQTKNSIDTRNWQADENSGFSFSYPSSYHVYRRDEVAAIANYDVDYIDLLPQNGVVIQIWHGNDPAFKAQAQDALLPRSDLGIFHYRIKETDGLYAGNRRILHR